MPVISGHDSMTSKPALYRLIDLCTNNPIVLWIKSQENPGSFNSDFTIPSIRMPFHSLSPTAI